MQLGNISSIVQESKLNGFVSVMARCQPNPSATNGAEQPIWKNTMSSLLRVAIVSQTYYYAPLWIAKDKGFFEREGLDVHIHTIGNRSPADLLYKRSLELAISPPDSVLRDVDQDGRLRIVAGNSDRLSHCLITQPEIKSVEELRGKKFGILSFTEGSFFHFQALAKAHGLHYPGDYEVVETGGAPLRHQMLLERKIDAGLQSFPWVYVAESLGFNNIADVSDYLPVWQFNTINADLAWVESHQELLVRFLKAMLLATTWFYGNRDGASEVAARHLGISMVDSQSGWDYFARTECITPNLEVSPKGMEKVYEALTSAKLVQGNALKTNATWEWPTALREAQRQVASANVR